MDAKEKARELNAPGAQHKNCCQSVLASLCNEVGMDEETALKIGVCFGGGVMNGDVCGAVLGALMYLGLKYGDSPATKRIGNEFLKKFREANGCLCCRDLVERAGGDRSNLCPKLIENAIEIVGTL